MPARRTGKSHLRSRNSSVTLPEERGFLLVISSRQVTRNGTRKQYAAFLFDMDGVLIHSTPVHNESWQLYLREHGVHEDQRSIESKMLGKHNEEIVRIFFGENLSPAEIFRHGAEKEKVYRRLMKPRFAEYLVPGIREFLERHRDVPMGVAANRIRAQWGDTPAVEKKVTI